MAKTPPRRRRRKDARPQEIVDAAMRCFTENGFAGTKIQEIADAANVAKGTVYLYFDTKDALFEAAVRQNVAPYFAELDTIASQFPGTARELLTLIIEGVYRELIQNEDRRVIMQILIAEGARFPQLTQFYYKEIVSGGKQLLRKVLKRGIDSGEFRQTLALQEPEIVMGPAIMASVWKMIFDDVAPLNNKQFVQAHIDLVLNGLLV